MGLDSESSCEEPEFMKIEIITEENVEITTDDTESPSKQEVKIHVCTYEGCNKKFTRPSKLQAHLCYHTGERAFKCEHEGCDKSYSRPQHLRRHVTTAHNKESKNRKFIRCPYPDCMMELSNHQNLKKHYYRKHEKKHPYTCDYCDKGFPKHHQLKQHVYQHTGIPPFRCSECNVGFTKIGDLNRHKRSHRTYTCTFADCGVVFKTWSHLRSHMKLNHPAEFSCRECGRIFRTRCRLKVHAVVHREPNEREIFLCNYPNCPSFYFKKSNLSHHIKSSHEGKKYECTYEGCDRKLCTKQKLDLHMKLHKNKRSVPRQRKKAKKRCDAGSHKRSMAVKLSGVKVPYKAEAMLLKAKSVMSQESDPLHLSPQLFSTFVGNELSELHDNRLSENTVRESVVMNERQRNHCGKSTHTVNCSPAVHMFPVEEMRSEHKDSLENLMGNKDDRLSSNIEITLTPPSHKLIKRNYSNLISEQQRKDLVMEEDQEKTVISVVCDYDSLIPPHMILVKDIETECKENEGNIMNNGIDRIPNSSEIAIDSFKVNERNSTNCTSEHLSENVVMEIYEVNYSGRTVLPLDCDHNSGTSIQVLPIKEKETECQENMGNIMDIESDRISSNTEITITVPSNKVNEKYQFNINFEQQNRYSEVNCNESQSNGLQSSEDIDISSIPNEHIIILPLDKDTNLPNENFNIPHNLDKTSDVLFDLNNKSLMKCDNLSILNVPLGDEICPSVMCINSDNGTLLQDLDPASADKGKAECIAEDKLLLPALDGLSEKEKTENQYEGSCDSIKTKLCHQPEESSQGDSSSKISKTVKRARISNRKILAKYKKLKTAEVCAKKSIKYKKSNPSNTYNKSSSTSSDQSHILNQKEGRTNLFSNIFSQMDESHITLETIYKKDKFIEDCLHVIDTKDINLVEERPDSKHLCDKVSEVGKNQNVNIIRQVSVTNDGKNISTSLGTSFSLKQNLFLRRKQKSLDQIVNSLHSVLENKLGGYNPSVPTTVLENEENYRNKYSEAECSKKIKKNVNTLSLLPAYSNSKFSANNDSNLRNLCAISQKALLETIDPVKSVATVTPNSQQEHAKQEELSKMNLQADITVKKWLKLMRETMQDIFPYLK